jgi:transcriptional regulator with XRE-family HTH domain
MNAEQMHVREVGKRVEALRVALGVNSQAKMAARLNSEVGTYNHWATGRRLIPVDAAIRLCAISGATLDYIYRGDVSGLPLRLTTLLESDEASSEGDRSA